MTRIVNNEADISRDFLKRFKEAGVSLADLASRADVSRNTVKTYLSGKAVRETTVQKISSALDSMIAEKTAVIEALPSNIQALSPSHQNKSDSVAMLTTAEIAGRSFVQGLELAVRKNFKDKKPVPASLILDLEMSIAQANTFLTKLKSET